MDLYLNPTSGDDTADGQSPATAFRTLEHLSRYVRDFAPGALSLRLRAGAPHVGTLDLSHPYPVSILPYDGDTATIQSGNANGFDYAGLGGLTVQGLRCVGSGQPSEGLHAGINVNARAANLHFEKVQATGYGFAGMLLMGDLDGVFVRKSTLDHNGNGYFVSGPRVRNLTVTGSTIAYNSLPHRWGSGFGLSINGAENIEVAGNHIHHNGIAGGGGCSGLMFYLCYGFHAHHNRIADNTDTSGLGDGQGAVVDNSRLGIVESNWILRCLNGGIQVHDEFDDNPPSDLTIRDNYVEGCAVGLSHQGGAGNILWSNNEVICIASGRYMTAIDLHRANAGTRFRRNILKAEGGALLLMADGGVGGATFGGDDWQSAKPAFVARERGFTSLAALLAAEPLGLNSRAGKPKGKPVTFLPGRPERNPWMVRARMQTVLEELRKAVA